MRRFCDSASVPNSAATDLAVKDGVDGWAGYLASPYATNGWSADELSRVLREVGRLLPIYVAPYPPDRITTAHAERDAAQAVAGLSAIRGIADLSGPIPLALDIEPGVYDAHPAAVVDYFDAFVDAIGGHADVIPYSSPTCLIGIRRTDDHPPRYVWCASWRNDTTTPTTVAPIGLGDAWHDHRAWQHHGQAQRYGMGVDLDVADARFPFLRHRDANPDPTPPPSTKRKTADVTIHAGGTTYRGKITAA